MKEYVFFAVACAAALSLHSCDPKKTSGDEVNAEYFDEAYDITEEDIIDPNDEEAYLKYRNTEEEETVNPEESVEPAEKVKPAETAGEPSDVDILDLPITETQQIDVLLDDMENINKSLARLYKDKEANATAIQNSLNRAVRITEKINEGAEADVMTRMQLNRYQKLTDEFLEVIQN